MGGKTIQISGFPSYIAADAVKMFLERHTGEGSVFAIKIRPCKSSKGRPRAFAIIQFVTRENATKMSDMIRQQSLLYSDGSYLKVFEMERDIVTRPKANMHAMEFKKLHFGCPLSEQRFSVLWSSEPVSVTFGFNMKKIQFFLSHKSNRYKLELSYDSIWEIKMHLSNTQDYQFLLIQVIAAPKIYELCTQGSLHNDSFLNYFKDHQDEQWVRTTDFTPLSSIGQSSALCLEVPKACNLPNISQYFVHYQELRGYFSLEEGRSYSHNLDLVPIVKPHTGIDVPYDILFKINHMVQNGTLAGPTLDINFYRLISPSTWPINYIERALANMSNLDKTCFSPVKWLQEEYKKFQKSKRPPQSASISLEAGLVYVHRVQVTPSKVYFYGPEINVSNRVLRHYSQHIDNFIRVSFVDEDCDKMHATDLQSRLVSAGVDRRNTLYWRVLNSLKNGISVGDKKFEFLAFSNSQLRENSTWMFASRNGLTAADIRNWMGDFTNIRNVAKYAARLGQSFGSSTETLTVEANEVEVIPDVERGVFIFSDGIGKISAEFAKKVAVKCGLKSSTPSTFQIRYGGYKGVVAVDPTSSKKLSLRKSMSKFESENKKLDILSYSKYQPCFLNRQLITLLSTLGVKDGVFERKQEESLDLLDEILTDSMRAIDAVGLMAPGETTNLMKELLLCDYKPNEEPFLSMLLQTFRETKVFELRTKARIFLPKGRTMMGCLDETRSLEYGQVFVQVSCFGSSKFLENGLSLEGANGSDNRIIVRGKVVVAKNPCLHPGDIRVLTAVDVPWLHHMVDCVVFPQKGARPHPNECSGSDLDGDLYFVSWDPELIPPRTFAPMDYTAAPSKNLDRAVGIEDVMVHFTDYIVNDSLGIIANAHTVHADIEMEKAFSRPCIELAKLFSIAVDFPKTGVPAVIPQELHVKEYPDFMEKPDRPSYEAKGVIGKLYRAVRDHKSPLAHIKSFTKQVALRSYDPDMEVNGFKEYLNDAFFYKEEYDFKLGNLMDHYGIKTEAEVFGGCIITMSKMFNKFNDREVVGKAVRSLRKEARTWFNEMGSDYGNGEDDVYAKASAWYYVTYHPSYWGCYNVELERPHFLSFAWCVYDKLVLIKQKRVSMRTAASELSKFMERGLKVF